MAGRRLGIAVVGLGGAVATTAAAGVSLIRAGAAGTQGLPLAGRSAPGLSGEPVALEDLGLAAYDDVVVRGWDLQAADLADAALTHGVLDAAQWAAAREELAAVTPWPAVGNKAFCTLHGDHTVLAETLREQTDVLRADLRRFRAEEALDGVVLVNLASTEAWPDPGADVLATPEAFERGLDEGDPAIGPAMLYAYAAIREGVPVANFTPSLAADVPALRALAESAGVPLAGKDGKTGQTMMKTVLAPAFRSRALHVEGWYSTNILGNRDGEALHDPASNASKIATKGSVLDACLGYPVADHVVRIDYYRPRGDAKEAWDNIDLVGFLGQRMQVKVDFLCRDSVLAAPLVLEICRLLDLASQVGEAGVQEQLGLFFKAPMTREPDAVPLHPLHEQEAVLSAWLAGVAARAAA